MNIAQSDIIRKFESISQYVTADDTANKFKKIERLMKSRRHHQEHNMSYKNTIQSESKDKPVKKLE